MKPAIIRHAWLAAATLVALAAMLLARASAAGLETLWDEQVDHDIAVALRDDPLRGESPALDASQTRLPMYLCALAMKLTGRTDLQLCRNVSLIAGGLTVILAAALARLLFNTATALVAALLLGFSPYFLSFARIAMTEGDVIFACAMTAAMLAYLRDLRRPTPASFLLAGIALGLAAGAKLFGIFLVPVFAVLATSAHRRPAPGDHSRPIPRISPELTNHTPPATLHSPPGRRAASALFATLGICAATALVAIRWRELAVAGWAAVLAAWCCLVVMILFRRPAIGRTPLRRLAAIVAFAGITFGAVMPVHLTSHDIAREVLRRMLRWDHQVPLALWSDHLRLYAGIVLIKLTVPLGTMSAVALVWAAFVERSDGRWRPCIIAILFYIVLICFLPLRQTFYLMGVYPFIAVTLAALITEGVRRLALMNRIAAATAVALALTLAAQLGVRLAAAYPNFHLYGYDVVGDRWLSAESRGYRNLIQTPSDGVESLVNWCLSSPAVREGDRVVSYLWEDRIVSNMMKRANKRLTFVPRGVTEASSQVPPPPPITEADWVLLHINNRLGYGDLPPDWPSLEPVKAGFSPVFTVRRNGFEVGWVYGNIRTLRDRKAEILTQPE